MLILRIASFIILIVSAVVAPWFVTATLAVIAMTLFSWFYEAVAVGFLLGAVYGFSGKGVYLFAFFPASFTISLFIEERSKNFFQRKNIISRTLIVFSGALSVILLWFGFEKVLFYL